jgi:DNA-binding NarL/FixJ family response regulator
MRVLVADDHRLMLTSVRRSLGRSDAVEVVGEVDDRGLAARARTTAGT